MDSKYALDANILISSSRTSYPFEIAPSFWNQLKEKGSNKIVLVDKIRDEIPQWLVTSENSFILKDSGDENIFPNYSKIMTFIQSREQYTEVAKAEFANVADSWLCAHALTYDYVIVTQETYDPNIKNRVKILNVCEKFSFEIISAKKEGDKATVKTKITNLAMQPLFKDYMKEVISEAMSSTILELITDTKSDEELEDYSHLSIAPDSGKQEDIEVLKNEITVKDKEGREYYIKYDVKLDKYEVMSY